MNMRAPSNSPFMIVFVFFNVLYAEIQILLVGIEICWQVNFKTLLYFSNSLYFVQLVTAGVDRFYHYVNLLVAICEFLVNDWSATRQHILHEENQSADILAKLGANDDKPLVHHNLYELM
jgi:ribonuclease HI